MCVDTWAPIKICICMLAHKIPHIHNYAHKTHVHTQTHKNAQMHATYTCKHTHSPSLPPSVPQDGQEPQESHLEAGKGTPAAGKGLYLCVLDWLCLLCVSVCKEGASGPPASLAACRSQTGSPPHCRPPPSVVPHLPVCTPGSQPRPWEPVYSCQGTRRQRGPAGTSAYQCTGPQFLRL